MPIIQLEHHPEYLDEVVKLEYDFDRDTGVYGDIVESTLVSIRERILYRMSCDYQHFISTTDTNSADGYLYAVPENGWMKIAGVYVKKESRRTGIAEKLIMELRRKTNKTLVSQIDSKNEASIQLHRKLGFDLYIQSPGFFDTYLSR